MPTHPTALCLDDNLIAGLLEGDLERAQRHLVERHLDACDECRHLVAGLARDADTTSAGPTRVEGTNPRSSWGWSVVEQEADEPRHSLLPGDRIDHFAIVRLLGRGGMGEVYLARDATLDREVAIKVISGGQLESARARARFFSEARTTAKLNHPNIVTIHAVGQHGRRPYLALEYVPGRTLRRWLADDRPHLDAGLRAFVGIAEALVAAHRQGVLHRDLKPDNVLIDEDGRVRVLDFGLAVMAEDMAESGVTLGAGIHTTGVAGTPRYMAPEQWRHVPLTGAVDVWALGVMLHELLSKGEHPFGLERVGDDSLPTFDDDPWTPQRLRSLPNEIPETLRSLVARCLREEPSERPSAFEVVRALREHLTPHRAARRSSSRPLAALTVAAVAIVASVTGGVWANDQQPQRLARMTPALTMATTLAVATSTPPEAVSTAREVRRVEPHAASSADASPQRAMAAPPSAASISARRQTPVPKALPVTAVESDEQLLRQW